MNDERDLAGEPACWAHLVDDMDVVEGRRGIDLTGVSEAGSSGAIWSLRHGGDLDANVVWLRPDDTIDEHVNDDVDVLVVVWGGDGRLTSDGSSVPLRPGVVVHIERGARRSVVAGSDGVTYLSVHRRRDGPSITRR